MSINAKKQTTRFPLYSLVITPIVLGLVGCSEPAKVTTTKQLGEDEIEICFDEPFKKGTLYSLDFLDAEGNHFNRSHYADTFATMYPNGSETCYIARLFNYFHVGNSTPQEMSSDLSLSRFESVNIQVATPKGMDNLSKNTPDEIIYSGTLILNQ